MRKAGAFQNETHLQRVKIVTILLTHLPLDKMAAI